MKINMKVAFIIAILIHAIILAVLLLRINLDKPSRPNLGKGDIMHATFVPPAKGKETGKASAKKRQEKKSVITTHKNFLLGKEFLIQKKIRVRMILEDKKGGLFYEYYN